MSAPRGAGAARWGRWGLRWEVCPPLPLCYRRCTCLVSSCPLIQGAAAAWVGGEGKTRQVALVLQKVRVSATCSLRVTDGRQKLCCACGQCVAAWAEPQQSGSQGDLLQSCALQGLQDESVHGSAAEPLSSLPPPSPLPGQCCQLPCSGDAQG